MPLTRLEIISRLMEEALIFPDRANFCTEAITMLHNDEKLLRLAINPFLDRDVIAVEIKKILE